MRPIVEVALLDNHGVEVSYPGYARVRTDSSYWAEDEASGDVQNVKQLMFPVVTRQTIVGAAGVFTEDGHCWIVPLTNPSLVHATGMAYFDPGQISGPIFLPASS